MNPSMVARKRPTTSIGVLVSGRGSNLEAILDAISRGFIKSAAVQVVVSSKPSVRALDVANDNGIPGVVLEARPGEDRESYDRRLLDALGVHGVRAGDDTSLVLLAGFMRLLSSQFVRQFEGRIMNIHPSLLPAFPGLNAQEQALGYGVKVAGCTVHFVVPEMDAGPIILQEPVPVLEDDNSDSLASRILEREHLLYPRAVKLFVEGRLAIGGRRVTIRPR